jgi:hypothetical protein
MGDVLKINGFYQLRDEISEGDEVCVLAVDKNNTESEISGEVTYTNHRKPERNNIVLLGINYEDTRVNVCSDGRVTLNPSETPDNLGKVEEAMLIQDD